MQHWVPVGRKHLRCPTHVDVEPWLRGKERCSKCPPPGDPSLSKIEVVDAAAAEPVKTPKGCRSLEQREARLTELADFAAKQAGAIVKDGKKSRISQSTAMKWLAEAIKAERAAAELGIPRERTHRTKRLEQLAAEILSGRKRRGGAH